MVRAMELVEVWRSGGRWVSPLLVDVAGERLVLRVEGERDVVGQALDSAQLRLRLHHPSALVYLGVHPWDPAALVTATAAGLLSKWDLGSQTATLEVELGVGALSRMALVRGAEDGSLAALLLDAQRRLHLIPCLSKSARHSKPHLLHKEKLPAEQSKLVFGERVCVWVSEHKAHLLRYSDRKHWWHGTSGRTLVSAAVCDEGQGLVAVGDSIGRVLVWRDVETCGIGDPWQMIHWHTGPARALAFSPAGNALLSGGDEQVLVRHSLPSDPSQRQALPRLSAPVLHIAPQTSSPDTLVLLQDNSVQLVSQEFRLQGKPVSGVVGHGAKPLGLVPDRHGAAGPVSKGSLWTNANPGFLQALHPSSLRCVATLDVCALNVPPTEQSGTTGSFRVTRAALGDGLMATVHVTEDRALGFVESHLSFWAWNSVDEKLELETKAVGPHGGAPVEALAEGAGVFASAAGKEFALWAKAGEDEHSNWLLRTTWGHKGLKTGPLAFSGDGSVLAVAFGRSVTLWSSAALLEASASSQTAALEVLSAAEEPVTGLEWLGGDSGAVLAALSRTQLHFWDTEAGSLQRSVSLKGSAVALAGSATSSRLVVATDEVLLELDGAEEEAAVETGLGEARLESVAFGRDGEVVGLGAEGSLWRLCTPPVARWVREKGLGVREAAGDAAEGRLKGQLAQWLHMSQKTEAAPTAEAMAKSRLELVAAPAHALPALSHLAQPFLLSCLAPKS